MVPQFIAFFFKDNKMSSKHFQDFMQPISSNCYYLYALPAQALQKRSSYAKFIKDSHDIPGYSLSLTQIIWSISLICCPRGSRSEFILKLQLIFKTAVYEIEAFDRNAFVQNSSQVTPHFQNYSMRLRHFIGTWIHVTLQGFEVCLCLYKN